MSPTRDWESWARTFESIAGPEEFAALFAPSGRFRDPVTPWTTDLHKVATDTLDAHLPGLEPAGSTASAAGEDWAVFESGRGRAPSTPARARRASPSR